MIDAYRDGALRANPSLFMNAMRCAKTSSDECFFDLLTCTNALTRRKSRPIGKCTAE
jgi:hypothetical protein